MKYGFGASGLLLFALLIALASRRPQPPSPVAVRPTPEIVFLKGPELNNGRLTGEIAVRKSDDQTVNYWIQLETMTHIPGDSEAILEDKGTIVVGGSAPTGPAGPLVQASSVSFEEILADHDISPKNCRLVRLKITMSQTKGDPKDWTRSDAVMTFGKWLPVT